jgi:hypothetical protein
LTVGNQKNKLRYMSRAKEKLDALRLFPARKYRCI